MEDFIKVHGDCIVGVLHGFDRLVLRGTLRSISHTDGLAMYLNSQRILLKDFDVWAQRCTRRLDEHIQAVVAGHGRRVIYLASSAADKEQRALAIAREERITSGLVACLMCVENCMSPQIHRNAQSKKLELQYVLRKCKFYYLYLIDPVFGWMSIRLQSWIPFDVQVCVNGRTYLQRRLAEAGIGYEQADNCFTRIDDLPQAQKFLDQLVTLNWCKALRRLIAPLFPREQAGLLPEGAHRYYWSIRQSEVATDVMFKDVAALSAIYPRLCRHGIEALTCEDVMRFFNKNPSCGSGQVTSSCKRLVQGVRLKHQVKSNWIKMYDKGGSVLRIETTINDPGELRVFRGTLDKPDENPQWRPMAKAVADIQRRVTLCRQANERYLAALAVVGVPAPTAAVLDPVARPVVKQGQRTRALRPVSPDDAALFAAVMNGKHLLNGLTNGSLQTALFDDVADDPQELRRRSGQVSRQLRMLRRHGLIHKLGARRLYRVTAKGQQVMGLALAVRQSTNILSLAA